MGSEKNRSLGSKFEHRIDGGRPRPQLSPKVRLLVVTFLLLIFSQVERNVAAENTPIFATSAPASVFKNGAFLKSSPVLNLSAPALVNSLRGTSSQIITSRVTRPQITPLRVQSELLPVKVSSDPLESSSGFRSIRDLSPSEIIQLKNDEIRRIPPQELVELSEEQIQSFTPIQLSEVIRIITSNFPLNHSKSRENRMAQTSFLAQLAPIQLSAIGLKTLEELTPNIPSCCNPVSAGEIRGEIVRSGQSRYSRIEDYSINPFVVLSWDRSVGEWFSQAVTDRMTLTDGVDFEFSPEGTLGRVDQLKSFYMIPPKVMDVPLTGTFTGDDEKFNELLVTEFGLPTQPGHFLSQGTSSLAFLAYHPSPIVIKVRKLFPGIDKTKVQSKSNRLYHLAESYSLMRQNLVYPEVASQLAKRFLVKDEFSDEKRQFVYVAGYKDTPELWRNGILIQSYFEGPTASELAELVRYGYPQGSEYFDPRERILALQELRRYGFSSFAAARRELGLLEAFYEKTHPYMIKFREANYFEPTLNYDMKKELVQVGLDLNHGSNVMWISPRRDGRGGFFVIFDT